MMFCDEEIDKMQNGYKAENQAQGMQWKGCARERGLWGDVRETCNDIKMKGDRRREQKDHVE
jgi:hypothetical protein